MDPSDSPITSPTKDMEGVSDMFEDVAPPAAAAPTPAGGKRQKKIAVLTSGGDSAGMNAAGKSLLSLFVVTSQSDGQSGRSCVKVSPEDVRHSSSEKDGRVSFVETPPNRPPLLLR